jgi:hypothetical protein
VLVDAVNTNTGQVTPIANVTHTPNMPQWNFFAPVFKIFPGPAWVQVGVNFAKAPLQLTLDTAGAPMTIVDGGAGDCDFTVNLRILFLSNGLGCGFAPPAGFAHASGTLDVVPLGAGFFVRLTNAVITRGPQAKGPVTWKFTPKYSGQGPRQPPSAFGLARLIGLFGTSPAKGACIAGLPNPGDTVTLQGRANLFNIGGLITVSPAFPTGQNIVKLGAGGPAWTVDGAVTFNLSGPNDCVFLPGSIDVGVTGCGTADDNCVGGVVVDPDVGALALQSDSSSGSDAWLLTGSAIALASVMALGGGAWYVRRRRVR